jgi:N-acetylmuramoyl-L-alanine amidase
MPLELRERTGMATRGGAQVLVLIHQDSVQPRDLPTWTLQGRVREYTPHSRGFSLFVSSRNSFFAASNPDHS